MNDRVIFLEPGQVKRGWERFSHQTEDDDYYNDAMGDFGPIGRELRARYRASCATGGCGARGGHAGTPYCQMHAFEIWRVLDETMTNGEKGMIRARHDDKVAKARAAEEIRKLRPKTKPAPDTPRHQRPGYVYYLLVGDLIKIGWASVLSDRMKQYPPNSVLLASHPGTLNTERQMHHRHLHLLGKGREWFKIDQELLDHVDSVRATYTCRLAINDESWTALAAELKCGSLNPGEEVSPNPGAR